MWRVVAIVATGPCIDVNDAVRRDNQVARMTDAVGEYGGAKAGRQLQPGVILRTCMVLDRKSTRLNSSHSQISYAVFCLKKKKTFRTWTAIACRSMSARPCYT